MPHMEIAEHPKLDPAEVERIIRIWILTLGDQPISDYNLDFLLTKMSRADAMKALNRLSEGSDAILRRCLVVFPEDGPEFEISGVELESATEGGEVLLPKNDIRTKLAEVPGMTIFYGIGEGRIGKG